MDPKTFLLLLLVVLALENSVASDLDPLQDFCVRDTSSKLIINGFVCKAADQTKPEDFRTSLLSKPGNTSNVLKSAVTPANVLSFPGLNTLGVSMSRLDLDVGGLNPPHVHPRATELLFVQKGSVYVGFITTGDNKLFDQTLQAGDLFVFPRGLVHFQLNVGTEAAVGIAAFNSQNPGTSQVAKAVFASTPAVNDEVILKAFQLYPELLQKLRDLIKKT